VELPEIYRKLKMKRFLKWLRRDTRQQSIASEADQDDVDADIRPDQATEDENSAESSLTGSVLDQADSSIFDSGSSIIEKSKDAKSEIDDEHKVHIETLALEEELLPDDEAGVDPYNTGSFDSEK
jgi:hypothetical protein